MNHTSKYRYIVWSLSTKGNSLFGARTQVNANFIRIKQDLHDGKLTRRGSRTSLL